MKETFRVNPGNSDSTCHVLPCKINYDGAIETDMFKIEEGAPLAASFRGRPLVGRKVDLQGYAGVVLEEAEAQSDDESEDTKQLRVVRKFDSLAVWGHGQLPDGDDIWSGRVEELISLSRALAK